MTVATAWKTGTLRKESAAPRLLFGRMHEDFALESATFPPGGHIFCIASAGCTALELASRGHRVDAIDINAAQTDYLHDRIAGGAPREGSIGILRRGRSMMRMFGVSDDLLREFLLLQQTAQQVEFWKKHLAAPMHRLLSVALSPLWMRFVYRQQFLEAVPEGFASIALQRIERCISLHPNHTNLYLWSRLLGIDPPDTPERAPITRPMHVVCRDATEFLSAQPPEMYDAFSLSNILDGASREYAARMWRAVRHAARPGATVILRSIAEPKDANRKWWASQDRSAIWGDILVTRIFEEEDRCYTH